MTLAEFNLARNILAANRQPTSRRAEYLAGASQARVVTAYCGLGEYVDVVAVRRFNDGYEGKVKRNGRWQRIIGVIGGFLT